MEAGRDGEARPDRADAQAPQPQRAPERSARKPARPARRARSATARRAPAPAAPATSPAGFAVKDLAKKPRSKLPRGAGRPSQADEASVATAQQTTVIVVSGLNGFAGLLFGERAHMTEPEHTVISDPMQRMFERASPETLAVISVYMDPLALGVGFIAWLARIWREVREASEGEEGPGPGGPSPAEPGPPPDGDGREPIKQLEPVEEAAPTRVIELTPDELRRPAGSGPFARGVS